MFGNLDLVVAISMTNIEHVNITVAITIIGE